MLAPKRGKAIFLHVYYRLLQDVPCKVKSSDRPDLYMFIHCRSSKDV